MLSPAGPPREQQVMHAPYPALGAVSLLRLDRGARNDCPTGSSSRAYGIMNDINDVALAGLDSTAPLFCCRHPPC